MFRRLRLWLIKVFLNGHRFEKDETILIALKRDYTSEEMEDIADFLGDTLGDNVVLIGGVDKIIIAK